MDRRQARRGQAPTFKRYQMRQKLIAFGRDFYIENEQGQKVFKVAEGQDDVVILAVTVAVDMMAHAGR